MSEKEELPLTLTSIGAATATSDYHQRVGSSGEGISSSSSDVDPRFMQNSPTGLMISQSSSMCTVPPGLVPVMNDDWDVNCRMINILFFFLV